MATLIRMPEIAANTTSASIVSWSVNEGDAVAAGDCLAEVESEKAVIELEAEHAGVMGRILVQAGVETDVGTPIAVLLRAGEQGVDVEALLRADGQEAGGSASQQAAEQGTEARASQEAEEHNEKYPAGRSDARHVEQDRVQDQSAAALSAADGNGGEGDAVTRTSADVSPPDFAASPSASRSLSEGRIIASPIARRLAHESGISLSGLSGSGPNGRIVKRDVLAASALSAQPPRAGVAPTPSADYTDIPHTSMRRTIARRLSESKANIPHFYLRADCRMDALLALRAQVNADTTRKVSVNDFIVKAAAAALRQIPDMNVSWTDNALRRYQHIDISVAVSTDHGLVTPVVHDADTLLLSAVSARVADLARRARSGALEPSEYQGGSFTISNLGMYGVREFAAIINPPQAAILAVGAAEQRAVVEDGALGVSSMMTVTLSVDHRAIDGALAARWLDTFKRIVEHPALALV
ncbi:pyruvate dehydrogenase complex dihydrolipoamide acetyltransferase [Parapusillimonas sp. SGNA-6]|nr:pyruvate dehydrogenase complex dihydrolipoamide acetyltransferase [Parapusillimonas sp. SGNA-6]